MFAEGDMDESNEILTALERWSAGAADVDCVYLFGSSAAGHARPDSDVDLGVLLDTSVAEERYLDRRLEVMAALEPLLNRRVDVVILNRADPLLSHRIIARGKLVYCRDPVRRVRFETSRITEYLDTLPLYEEYDRVLEQRAREGRLLGRS